MLKATAKCRRRSCQTVFQNFRRTMISAIAGCDSTSGAQSGSTNMWILRSGRQPCSACRAGRVSTTSPIDRKRATRMFAWSGKSGKSDDGTFGLGAGFNEEFDGCAVILFAGGPFSGRRAARQAAARDRAIRQRLRRYSAIAPRRSRKAEECRPHYRAAAAARLC